MTDAVNQLQRRPRHALYDRDLRGDGVHGNPAGMERYFTGFPRKCRGGGVQKVRRPTQL